MLTGVNGTIKLVGEGGQKIQLAISEDDYEEFKKYKDVDRSGDIINDKFYAGYTLDDQQLYITGFYPQEELGDNIIIDVKCVGEKGGKYQSRLEEMKNLLGLNNGKEEIMVKALSCHPTVQLLEEKNVKTTELEAVEEQLKGKNEELEAANQKAGEELRTKTQELRGQLDAANNGKEELETQLKNQPDAAQLKEKDEEIKTLKDEVQKLQKEITGLKTKIQQPNTEIEKLKKGLKAKQEEVATLREKNKELEAKNKTTEQPKQGNGAKYTATVGMGLASGLIAFTALERTVKLEMLVMIGIAVASALVAGGITYAVLPSTQVDGAEAQEVSGDKKSK